MAETPVNHNGNSTSPIDSSSCEECGGSGYIDHSGSLSYGDPGYGDPDGNKEPCPKCNPTHNSSNQGSSTSNDDAGCLLVIIGIVILVGVIISVVIWLAR